jgi:hypothetical protein
MRMLDKRIQFTENSGSRIEDCGRDVNSFPLVTVFNVAMPD